MRLLVLVDLADERLETGIWWSVLFAKEVIGISEYTVPLVVCLSK